MAISNYTSVDKYIVTAVCDAPLHIGSAIGSKEEILVHPVDGKPFIQASSISGVMRTVSRAINGTAVTEQLFGPERTAKDTSEECEGNLRISDGTFQMDTVQMELRPRVKINPETGSVQSEKRAQESRNNGQKFETESIGEGAVFTYTVYLYDASLKAALESVFAELNSSNVQIGGQKTNGSGYITLQSLKHKAFSMKNAAERKLWNKEESLPEKEYKELKDKLVKSDRQMDAYRIILTGETEGELLIKSIAVTEYGKDAPDSKNIQNAKKEYIIPGSSLKGVLRNRMTYIAKCINKEVLIDEAFGSVGKSGQTGTSGKVFVKDTVVGDREFNDKAALQHRIHIDKFTAGVMHGGLFSEKDVAGTFAMEISVGKCEAEDAVAGMLILALRDLAAGLFNVGSGYNIGKGFIEASTIEVVAGNTKAVVDMYGNTVEDPAGIITGCLAALKNWEKGGSK